MSTEQGRIGNSRLLGRWVKPRETPNPKHRAHILSTSKWEGQSPSRSVALQSERTVQSTVQAERK